MNKKELDLLKATSMDIVRAADMHVLKDGGAWVTYKGNPLAPRGMRITTSQSRLGIQHLDIYYAINEECPWKVELPKRFRHDVESAVEACEAAMVYRGVSDMQLTKVDLVTWRPERICAWAGEIAVMSLELIEDMLAHGYLEIKQFRHSNPVWDEETRDIIGGMMLDGYSLQQAQSELVRAGEMRFDQMHLPGYFYRPAGEYREMFVEEEQ